MQEVQFNPALNRRQFVKSATAASGGLVIGFYLPGPMNKIFAAPAAKMVYPPNAFIHIAPDNSVTILVNKLEFGQGVFTSLPMLIAEELGCDWQMIKAEHAPTAPVYANPMMGLQMTGGSTSVTSSYDQLRLVGAQARTMLVKAAADKWHVSERECEVDKGFIHHKKTGNKASFGELTDAANKRPIPASVKLKEPKNFTIIGKATLRLDSSEKANGTAKFGLDITLPDMLTVVVARAPTVKGVLKSFDATKAKEVKGVVDVVKVPSGVAVVAKGFWAAKKGREALVTNWEEKNAQLSTETMRQEYHALANKPGTIAKETGKQKELEPKHSITAEYELPYLAHAPMEPLNCLIDLQKDKCRVWAGTQFQTVDQANLAKALGFKPDQVELITTLAGGGFGRRANPTSDYLVEAAEIAKIIKKPVKLVWTREDDLAGGYYRPMFVHKVSAGVDKNGRLIQWDHTAVGQSIVAGTPFADMMEKGGIDPLSVEGIVDMPYAIPNLRVSLHSVKSDISVLWWRSVGHTHTAFVVETMIDELAHLAKKDPLEFRRGLLKKRPRELRTLELAAKKANWGKPLPQGHAHGIAVHESFSSVVAHVAEVSLENGEPRIHKIVSAIDCGRSINPLTITAQVEGAAVYGLSAMLFGEITFKKGQVEQTNFNNYPVCRMSDIPPVEVHIVDSSEHPTGVGEPGTPPIAPAVANAIFALTQKPVRKLPLAGQKFG